MRLFLYFVQTTTVRMKDAQKLYEGRPYLAQLLPPVLSQVTFLSLFYQTSMLGKDALFE